MNPDDTHEKELSHRGAASRVEQLPSGAEQANDQESLRAALDVVRRVHRANPSVSPAISTGSSEVWLLSEEIKRLESQQLSDWALANNLLFDADEFTRYWFDFGCVEGGEHQIFQMNGYFYKRNNLAFHTSYLEYFERLVLHNWLFPDTAYQFEGVQWVTENESPAQLRPVVTQKALRGVRGATRAEVEAEMSRMGFVRRYEDNYFHPALSLFVDDLHDQNVLVDATGDLLIFDPVIYLTFAVEH